jgi:hypothetical protein
MKQAHAFREPKKGSLLWIHGKREPVSLKMLLSMNQVAHTQCYG